MNSKPIQRQFTPRAGPLSVTVAEQALDPLDTVWRKRSPACRRRHFAPKNPRARADRYWSHRIRRKAAESGATQIRKRVT